MGWVAPFLLILLGAFYAPGFTADAAAAPVFHRGNEAEPGSLDPQKSSTVAEAHILHDLYEGLLIQDGAGELAPGTAESWTVSPDGKTYTFALRQEARWSNGDPVVAEDFVFALRRLVDPATAAEYANVLYPVVNAEAVNTGKMPASGLGVEAKDDRTLIIRLAAPTPYFLELLAHQTTLPIHRASFATYGAEFVKPGRMVSNGAYRLVETVPGSYIRLAKNPHYYAAPSVSIETVDYILVKELAAGVRRFRAGEIDLLPDVPADQIKSLRQTLGEELVIAPLQGTIYFAFNTSKAPYNDKRVRQALAMAIDRDFLAETIASGSLFAADTFVPPGTAFTREEPPAAPWQSLSLSEREKKAKALLAEAGFGAARPLSVEYRYNITDNNKAMAVAIADMWKRIGVETRFVSTDSTTHFNYLRDKGDYDVARAGWVADYNDAQNFLFLLQSGSGLNYMRWSNPAFDRLMTQAAGETERDRRTELLSRAEELVLDETPLTPIAYYAGRYLVSKRLKGWIANLRAANATRFLSLDP